MFDIKILVILYYQKAGLDNGVIFIKVITFKMIILKLIWNSELNLYFTIIKYSIFFWEIRSCTPVHHRARLHQNHRTRYGPQWHPNLDVTRPSLPRPMSSALSLLLRQPWDNSMTPGGGPDLSHVPDFQWYSGVLFL